MKPSWGGIFTAILAFAGCTHPPPPAPPPQAHPHYVLGKPYQAAGHWYYPAETYALDQTGIAALQSSDGNALTTDGELADPSALTAAMPAIQLPAIVNVTNLENGRQIAVRVNQRGPGDPARLIALSPRAAQLLLMNGPTRGARDDGHAAEPRADGTGWRRPAAGHCHRGAECGDRGAIGTARARRRPGGRTGASRGASQ